MRTRRTFGLGLAVLVGALSSVPVGTGPASAHVTVNPREAVQGGYAKLAFRVPNEKAGASTTPGPLSCLYASIFFTSQPRFCAR